METLPASLAALWIFAGLGGGTQVFTRLTALFM